jgi:hypothetical protein
MKITASALSLNVEDITASANFVKQYFGFSEEMSAEGFVSLSRSDAGFNLVFLKIGLETFKPIHMRGHRADGLLVLVMSKMRFQSWRSLFSPIIADKALVLIY